MKQIDLSSLRDPKSYQEYHRQIKNVVERGTDHPLNYSEGQVAITLLNQKRMLRHDRRFQRTPLLDELGLANLELEPTTWVVLTEGWCGDAAHIMPVIAHLAEALGNVKLRIVNRDQNLEVMDGFLTNGGRAIPKLIVTDSKGCVLGSWGARPEVLQAQFLRARNQPDFDQHLLNIHIQSWYNNDKGLTTAREIVRMLERLEVATCFDGIDHRPHRALV